MVQPNVSMLALLKEQRARKAAAKKAAEESETESETQPFDSEILNPLPASENPPSTSENPTPTRQSRDSSDEAAVPPAFRRKVVAGSESHAQLEHNLPIQSENTNTRRSTPPQAVASISGPNQLRHREPSLQPQLRHTSQASQQLRERQTQSTQKQPSSVKKSHRPKI